MGVEVVHLHSVQLDKGFCFQFLACLAEGTFRHQRFGHDRLAFQIEELVEFILEGSLYQVQQEQNHRHEGQTTLASESLDRLPMAFQKIRCGQSLPQSSHQFYVKTRGVFWHLSLLNVDIVRRQL